MKLYLSNLPFALNQEELRELLEPHTTVLSVKLIHMRGFGFAEVENPDCIASLDGKMVYGREIQVSEAVNSDQYTRPVRPIQLMKRKRPRRIRE